jgi:ABC-type phosphate/phosphonate transport system substrate-binding protein
VVRRGSAIKEFGDLKDKDIAILESRLPCRLFADKNTSGQPRNKFARFFQAPNGQEALSDVLSGKVKAAIVDTPTLDHFKDLYPGRYKRLTILAQSPPFPPPVIVYRTGGLPADVLKKFKKGMLKVSQTEKGRQALMEFGILRFQQVPKDFQKNSTEIATMYPAPQHSHRDAE